MGKRRKGAVEQLEEFITGLEISDAEKEKLTNLVLVALIEREQEGIRRLYHLEQGLTL